MYARRLQRGQMVNTMTPVRFDSCMREDCNPEGSGVGGVGGVLIHACARIATATISAVGRPTGISIHACARIATVDGLYHQASDRYILIHACARIATL